MDLNEDRQMLRELAQKLEAWAREASNYGWSTQHVKPMQEQALRIWSHLGRTEGR